MTGIISKAAGALCAGVMAAAAFALPAKAVGVQVDFDLTTDSYIGFTHQYSAGGVVLTLSGGLFSDAGEVYSGASAVILGSPLGVGIQSEFFDLPIIDGHRLNEVAILSFDREVQLESLTFNFGDGTDDFTLFVGDGSGTLVAQSGQSAVPAGSVFLFSEVFLSDMFGVGAKDNDDNFLLSGVSVLVPSSGGSTSPVPLPAPLLMLGSLLLIGGAASRIRANRKTA